jgi:hypothetical protein
VARPRYVVQTVTGYAEYTNHHAKPHLSAHICDSVYLYEVVATYRSKDPAPIPGHRQRRLGNDGALAAANEHAERLNRDAA